VVGVTFEQACDYCKWRTDRVKECVKEQLEKGKGTGLPGNVADLYYRLPSQSEWQRAAYAGLDTAACPFGFEFLNDTVHVDKVNVMKSYDNVVGMDYGGEPMVSDYALPNRYGFYNMIGNIAEMTGEKGISKGGSWRHYLDQCHIRDSIYYNGPSNWLGFRCACIVKYKSGCDPVNGKKLNK
jgi:formylglycine-generating enzyme required for sulfatase activity